MCPMASVPCSLRQDVLGEDSATSPMALWARKRQAVGGDDARRFLSAMLQRVQPEVSQLLRLRVSVDRHHSALVMKFVEACSYQPLALSHHSPRRDSVSAAQPSEARQSSNPPPSLPVPSAAPSPARLRTPRATRETAADTTTLPSSLISTRSGTVSPITSAEMPYFTATCLILPKFSRSQEITTRLASSPNSTNSGGKPVRRQIDIAFQCL